MTTLLLPIQFLAAWIATWMARHQERVVDQLKEENRALRQKLGGRVRLGDLELHRLAKVGYELARKGLSAAASRYVPSPAILRAFAMTVSEDWR